jgi:hypothetical protein
MTLTQPKSHLLDLIFQRNTPSNGFMYQNFHFNFVAREPNSDISFYDVNERGTPEIRLRLVTTTQDCGPESILDLVKFCWVNAERFNSIKYAVVVLPKFCYGLPFGYGLHRLICLRYYRAVSDGWRDELNCRPCTTEYQGLLRPLVGCHLPATCRCTVCLWQPPSLRDAASHVLFRDVYKIQHVFHLISNTAFNVYVYAVRSGRVDTERLLPPAFPIITLWSATNTSLNSSHHLTCPVHGVWQTSVST